MERTMELLAYGPERGKVGDGLQEFVRDFNSERYYICPNGEVNIWYIHVMTVWW